MDCLMAAFENFAIDKSVCVLVDRVNSAAVNLDTGKDGVKNAIPTCMVPA